jgi:hypothetical protein
MAGGGRSWAARSSTEEGITDLPDSLTGAPPSHPAKSGGPPPNLFLFAAAAVLVLAAFVGLQDQPGLTAEASAQPSAAASPSHRTAALPTARPTSPPLAIRLSTPQHLQLNGKVGFFVGDMWVTVTLPPGSEGDYVVDRALDVGWPDGGITITADDLSSRCLGWPGVPPDPSSRVLPGLGWETGAAFTLAGYPGRYFEFGPEDEANECHPNAVWDSIVPGLGGRGLDVRLQLWALHTPQAQHLVFGSYMGTDAAARAQETIQGILASVQIDSADRVFDGGDLPDGPVEAGWYWARADNSTSMASPEFVPLRFVLHVPTGGWTSSRETQSATAWQLSRGSPGEPDAAVVRVGRIDGVYADPCNHVPAPAVDSTATALGDAIARIPGVEVLERSTVPVPYATADYIALRIPDGIGCQAPDFSLWYDEVEGERAATATGSTIRLWVFTPNDRSVFGRVAFEAETYADADPLLESDILQMLYSIRHGG